MKTKILLSITMLMMLIFFSCTSTQTDPYKGLVKINASYYLVVGEKTIPVDSGITYTNALEAYNHPNKLFPAGTKTRKINWIMATKKNVYILYTEEKISIMFGKENKDYTIILLVFFLIVAGFGAACKIPHLIAEVKNNLRSKLKKY